MFNRDVQRVTYYVLPHRNEYEGDMMDQYDNHARIVCDAWREALTLRQQIMITTAQWAALRELIADALRTRPLPSRLIVAEGETTHAAAERIATTTTTRIAAGRYDQATLRGSIEHALLAAYQAGEAAERET